MLAVEAPLVVPVVKRGAMFPQTLYQLQQQMAPLQTVVLEQLVLQVALALQQQVQLVLLHLVEEPAVQVALLLALEEAVVDRLVLD
jgi:hypothetical protein